MYVHVVAEREQCLDRRHQAHGMGDQISPEL